MNKKIKLSILGTLIAGSALAVTLPIVSCSSSDSNVMLVLEDSISLNDVEAHATQLLKNRLDVAITNDAKKNVINQWEIGVPLYPDETQSIKSFINFKDGDKIINGNDVIESITFYSTTTIPNSGPINGIKLKVHIKAPYSWNSNILQLGNLGDAIGDLTLDDIGNLEVEIRTIYVSYLTISGTYENRKILVESWKLGNQIYPEAIDVFKNETIFKINGNVVPSADVIDNVTYNENGFMPPYNSSIFIYTPSFKVNLKPEYASFKEFIISGVNIGLPT